MANEAYFVLDKKHKATLNEAEIKAKMGYKSSSIGNKQGKGSRLANPDDIVAKTQGGIRKKGQHSN